MIKKMTIIVCSTLLLAVLILFGVSLYSRYATRNITCYVASHQIAQRTKISENDLLEIEVPKDYLNDDVFIEKSDIIGKYVKLSYSIPKGSLIYKTSLESDIKDLANTLLKEGEVNYDVYMSDVKINTANLNKNMSIDIYLTINNKDRPISDLLISNARITGLYDSNNKPILDYDNDSRVQIISIAVNKEYVNVLNKAQVLGVLNCVINNNTYDTTLLSNLNTNSKLFEYIE